MIEKIFMFILLALVALILLRIAYVYLRQIYWQKKYAKTRDEDLRKIYEKILLKKIEDEMEREVNFYKDVSKLIEYYGAENIRVYRDKNNILTYLLNKSTENIIYEGQFDGTICMGDNHSNWLGYTIYKSDKDNNRIWIDDIQNRKTKAGRASAALQFLDEIALKYDCIKISGELKEGGDITRENLKYFYRKNNYEIIQGRLSEEFIKKTKEQIISSTKIYQWIDFAERINTMV